MSTAYRSGMLGLSCDSVITKLKEAVNELVEKYGDKVVAVGLFGSYARGEANERSDVDVIVVVRNWNRGLERRFQIYDVLHRYLRRDITLIDLDYQDIEEILARRRTITATMLNIIYDCIPVYDPLNILKQLKELVSKVISELGLERYRIGRAYGWKRRDGKPLVPIKLE